MTARRPKGLALASAIFFLYGSAAAAPTPSEYEVKAAFLYNFARFVEWPEAAAPAEGQPFVVAVLGDDPFGNVLERTLAGKTALSRPIELRRASAVEAVRDAHIVFIGGHEPSRVDPLMKALAGTHALVVGEMEGFASRGGMIGFRTERRRVRFDINVEEAHRAGLKVSSQLLKLARIVPSAAP